MAVEVLELLLDAAAEAASVVPVQPLAHHAHAVLTLVFVERKVLHLGGDATSPAGLASVLHNHRRPGSSGHVLTEGRETDGQAGRKRKPADMSTENCP